jgi:hypothetical protein
MQSVKSTDEHAFAAHRGAHLGVASVAGEPPAVRRIRRLPALIFGLPIRTLAGGGYEIAK